MSEKHLLILPELPGARPVKALSGVIPEHWPGEASTVTADCRPAACRNVRAARILAVTLRAAQASDLMSTGLCLVCCGSQYASSTSPRQAPKSVGSTGWRRPPNGVEAQRGPSPGREVTNRANPPLPSRAMTGACGEPKDQGNLDQAARRTPIRRLRRTPRRRERGSAGPRRRESPRPA